MCVNSPLNERVYRLLNLLSGPEKIIYVLSNFVRNYLTILTFWLCFWFADKERGADRIGASHMDRKRGLRSVTELLVIWERLEDLSPACILLWCSSPQMYFSVSSSDLFHRRGSDGASLQCAASRGTSGCAGPSAIFHSSCRGNLLLCGKTCADGVPVSGRKPGRTRRRDTASLRCGSSDGTRGSLRDTDSRRSVNMH